MGLVWVVFAVFLLGVGASEAFADEKNLGFVNSKPFSYQGMELVASVKYDPTKIPTDGYEKGTLTIQIIDTLTAQHFSYEVMRLEISRDGNLLARNLYEYTNAPMQIEIIPVSECAEKDFWKCSIYFGTAHSVIPGVLLPDDLGPLKIQGPVFDRAGTYDVEIAFEGKTSPSPDVDPLPPKFNLSLKISESFVESNVLDRFFPTDNHEFVKLFIETDKDEYLDGELVFIKWNATNIGTQEYRFPGSIQCKEAFQLSLDSGEKEFRHGHLRFGGNHTGSLALGCMLEVVRHGIITPGQTIEDSFVWNQIVYRGYNNEETRPEPGYYNLKVSLGGVRACKEIKLIEDEQLPPKPILPKTLEFLQLDNTNNFQIKHHIDGGELTSADVYFYDQSRNERQSMYLLFNLQTTNGGTLILEIPDNLIQKFYVNTEAHSTYNVVVDGENVLDKIEFIDNCVSDTIIIPFDSDTKQIGILGFTFDKSRISDSPVALPLSQPECWFHGQCPKPSESDDDVFKTNTIRVTKEGIKPRECGIPVNDLTSMNSLKDINKVCVYPKKIVVNPGDTVFWESHLDNEGGILHAGDVRWLEKSKWVWPGNSFNFTFNEPGAYYYSVRGSDLVERDIGWIFVTDNQEAIDNAKDLSSVTNPDDSYRECPYLLKVVFKKTTGLPVCVTMNAAEKLIERGWARP